MVTEIEKSKSEALSNDDICIGEKRNKHSIKKELSALAIFLIVAILFTAVVSSVLTPKRTNYGSTWGQYVQEKENSIDVLFFGSSITYCDVVPSVIFENSNISSYVMAGPEQTIPITYYYLRESTKMQSPKVIFLEVTGMFFEQYQNFTQANIGLMPFGKNRLHATFEAAEPNARTGLLFPPYDYHSRWDELTGDDFKYALFGYNQDKLAGYTFLDTAEQHTNTELRNEKDDTENYKKNLQYLQKIVDYCNENNIKPVFYLAPTYSMLSDEHLKVLSEDISKMDNVSFYNFNDSEYDMGLSGDSDYYDIMHFNCFGAEKFSDFLSKLFVDELGMTETENPDKQLWHERYECFCDLYNGKNQ